MTLLSFSEVVSTKTPIIGSVLLLSPFLNLGFSILNLWLVFDSVNYGFQSPT